MLHNYSQSGKVVFLLLAGSLFLPDFAASKTASSATELTSTKVDSVDKIESATAKKLSEKHTAPECDLLLKFYPVAKLLRKTEFKEMSAQQLNNYFSTLIDVFDKYRWFYFCNSPKSFDGKYLDRIISELGTYARFLDRAKVDHSTGYYPVAPEAKVCFLRDYWKHLLSMKTYDRFYALYSDYLFIKIYSYPMRMTLDVKDMRYIVSAYGKLNTAVSKLDGSDYENYYQRAMERSQRIMKLLEQKNAKKEGDLAEGEAEV